jgi:hypothetical protein
VSGRRGVTTAKPETQVKGIMEQARTRYHAESGLYTPPARRTFTFTHSDTSVTLHCERLAHGATAGKPWKDEN